MRNSISLALFSNDKLGLMAIFEGFQPVDLLETIIKVNPDTEQLNHCFQFPGGQKISYDVYAPKDKWVIVSVNNQATNCEFDGWPLMEGDFQYPASAMK